ncbi:MAG: trypsin-like peptidase domain-containing protein [SAR324 cluster bacterium]|nr:trypsin-like peptidase domain-containing protein [SAR324 cluster bacterium]
MNAVAVAQTQTPMATMPVQQSPLVQIIEFAKQTVVNISTIRPISTQKQNQNPNQQAGFTSPNSGEGMESIGSGVIVTQDGYIVTNYHVVQKSPDLYVIVFTDNGTSQYPAEIIAMSERLDLALIKIEPNMMLQPAPLSNDRRLSLGEEVVAIGSPFGLDQTVSKGIISGLKKSIRIDNITHKNLIQTDAAINRGNSGGPLIDMTGYVIGINTAIYVPSASFAGISFAVSSKDAIEFLEDLIRLPRIQPNLNAHAKAIRVAAVNAPAIVAGTPNPHGDRGPCELCHQIIGNQSTGQFNNAMPVAAVIAPPIMAGAAMPHGDRGPCEQCHQIINPTQSNAAMPVAAIIAPPIMAGAAMPHGDRGPCEQCHQIIGNQSPGQQFAASPNVVAQQNQFAMPPGRYQGNQVPGQPQGANVAFTVPNMDLEWMGAFLKQMTQDVGGGVFLSAITPNSKAQKAGLQAGDIIFRVEGKKILDPKDLIEFTKNINDTARVSVIRNGNKQDIFVDLQNKPAPVDNVGPPEVTPPDQPAAVGNGIQQPIAGNGAEPPFAGNGAEPPFAGNGIQRPPRRRPALTELELLGMELTPNMNGQAQVTDIGRNSVAFRSGIRMNDLILSIDQVPIESLATVNELININQPDNAIEIVRGNRQFFIRLTDNPMPQNQQAMAGNVALQNRMSANQGGGAVNGAMQNPAPGPAVTELEILGMEIKPTPEGGALVRNVDINTLAYNAGIRKNDIIVSIDQVPIKDLATMQEMINVKQPDNLVEIARNNRKQFLTLK